MSKSPANSSVALPYNYDTEQRKVTVRDASEFPEAIFDIAEDVEVLDLSGGNLSSLPDKMDRFKNLRVVFLSNNNFEEVPRELAACENLELLGMRACKIREFGDDTLPAGLRGLILTDNQITSIPRSIGACTQLQKFMMAGNQLSSLPEELLGCQNLEIVRFSVNSMVRSPDWLFELPKLAWYADSSNLYSPALDTHPAEIKWDDIALGEELGRSVNNVVYYGRLVDGREVAVKQFGHDLVTDGLPADDMNACLAAGNHPNVVGGMGKVVGAPDGQQRLVMPLILGEFAPLGKPPSLTTMSRDTYPEGQVFSAAYILRALRTVAAGMQHLHGQGVMHGDLYGHNIMTAPNGESRVGDFGAASLYKIGSTGGKLRERLDVRAFGYLIEELSSRIDPSAGGIDPGIRSLQEACLDKDVHRRPSFDEITGVLAA